MADNDIRCSSCLKPFGTREPIACISGKLMGDECTDCYFWCEPCGVYTIRLYRDSFQGSETEHYSNPIPKEEGDRRLALIRRCSEPWNERCRCDAHREYFGGWLD